MVRLGEPFNWILLEKYFPQSQTTATGLIYYNEQLMNSVRNSLANNLQGVAWTEKCRIIYFSFLKHKDVAKCSRYVPVVSNEG